MPQKLSVKKRNDKGEPYRVEVTVLRSWHDAGGKTIYLHSNGVFGYKDGAPVRDFSELAPLASDKMSYQVAERWWNTVGAKASKAYYDAHDEQQRELAMRGLGGGGTGAMDSTSLDMVQYIRRPIKKRSKDAYCEPSSWPEFFDQRPDWWGAANVIEIDEFRYQIVALEDTASAADDGDDGGGDSPEDL